MVAPSHHTSAATAEAVRPYGFSKASVRPKAHFGLLVIAVAFHGGCAFRIGPKPTDWDSISKIQDVTKSFSISAAAFREKFAARHTHIYRNTIGAERLNKDVSGLEAKWGVSLESVDLVASSSSDGAAPSVILDGNDLLISYLATYWRSGRTTRREEANRQVIIMHPGEFSSEKGVAHFDLGRLGLGDLSEYYFTMEPNPAAGSFWMTKCKPDGSDADLAGCKALFIRALDMQRSGLIREAGWAVVDG